MKEDTLGPTYLKSTCLKFLDVLNQTRHTKYFPLTGMLNHPVSSNIKYSPYLKFLEMKFEQSSTNVDVKTES